MSAAIASARTCRCGRGFRPDPQLPLPARLFCSRECYYDSLKVPLASVYRRDRGRCHLCGGAVRPRDASRDHLLPRSRGGATVWANIALAHRYCNSIRGDVTLAEWHRGTSATDRTPIG